MGRRRIISLLILTSVLLITLDVNGNAGIDRVRSVFSLAIEPFDAAARAASRPFIDAWRGATGYDELRRENEALRAELDAQRGAVVEARAATLEYQELLALSRITGSSAFPSVTAQVLGDSPGNFQYTVEINKGSVDGIAVGMPVVNGAGLLGKITRVFPNSSIVLLIVDPEFSIGAKVLTRVPADPAAETAIDGAPPVGGAAAPGDPLAPVVVVPPSAVTDSASGSPAVVPPEGGAAGAPTGDATTSAAATATASATTSATTSAGAPAAPAEVAIEVQRETGTLAGQGSGRPLILRFVEDSDRLGRITVGSTVETAGGIRSIAPPGIPIGVVSRVGSRPGSRSPVVEVTPNVIDLEQLSFVRVLLYVPYTSGG